MNNCIFCENAPKNEYEKGMRDFLQYLMDYLVPESQIAEFLEIRSRAYIENGYKPLI